MEDTYSAVQLLGSTSISHLHVSSLGSPRPSVIEQPGLGIIGFDPELKSFAVGEVVFLRFGFDLIDLGIGKKFCGIGHRFESLL